MAFEGYTPANLREIRSIYGLTQQDVASITGTASARTVAKWEKDIDSGVQRADMPHKKWLMLLAACREYEKSFRE